MSSKQGIPIEIWHLVSKYLHFIYGDEVKVLYSTQNKAN